MRSLLEGNPTILGSILGILVPSPKPQPHCARSQAPGFESIAPVVRQLGRSRATKEQSPESSRCERICADCRSMSIHEQRQYSTDGVTASQSCTCLIHLFWHNSFYLTLLSCFPQAPFVCRTETSTCLVFNRLQRAHTNHVPYTIQKADRAREVPLPPALFSLCPSIDVQERETIFFKNGTLLTRIRLHPTCGASQVPAGLA